MPRGAAQLREVARDLKVAGSPRGLRTKLRRNIVTAMKPLQVDVKSNALAIPASGRSGSTGLRAALAAATRIRVNLGVNVSRVRVITDGKLMPTGQQSLPTLMEGSRKWRHPVYGGGAWVDQAAHPYMAPAIPRHLPAISASVDKAVREVEAELARGV